MKNRRLLAISSLFLAATVSAGVAGRAAAKTEVDVGHRHHCAFVPASCLETEKFVSQISAFGSGRRVGGLHEGRLQINIARGDAAALALSTLVRKYDDV